MLLRKIYEVTRLIFLVIVFWIYCVGGGIMKKMMDSWMPDEKAVKAIPIPIPVLIKETANSPPPEMMTMMKTKDWIWKLMLLKVMKSHNKGSKCSKKMIVFPPKNKCKCNKHKKDCCNCGEHPCGAPPPPPPPEDEPDYYGPPGGLMMGWDSKKVFVYQQPQEKLLKQQADERKCTKGDCEGSRSKNTERIAELHHNAGKKNVRPNFENDFD